MRSPTTPTPGDALTRYFNVMVDCVTLLPALIVIFVTSSDSGSLAIDTITAGGKMDAPVVQRTFWRTLEGLAAIALLPGGGLSAPQGAAVSTGIPFTLVVLVMCYRLWFALRSERAKI